MANTKMHTLRNSFHGTEVRVRSAAETPDEAWFEIQAAVYAQALPTPAARARLRRVENALCGSADCRCGTVRG